MIASCFSFSLMKSLMLRILMCKASGRKLLALIRGSMRFIYYKILEELRLLLSEMHFYKKILFKPKKPTSAILTLFPLEELGGTL